MVLTVNKRRLDIYGGVDPEEIPAYKVSEIAHYLAIPKTTLRSWVLGQNYKNPDGERRFFRPLINPANRRYLSFLNLVEAHVLTALRRQHFVPMLVIREALEYILDETPDSKHPLAEYQFATIGKQLFVERAFRLTNISKGNQDALKEILDQFLHRIKRTPEGRPSVLYPFPRAFRSEHRDWNPPKTIAINPRVAYGRPVLAGTSIPTSVIAERIATGESLEAVAEDYDKKTVEILDAIRWELAPAA